MLAQRLDHVHLGVNSLAEWAPLFGDHLGLSIIRGVTDPSNPPPELAGQEMFVAEYQVGDGFVALLQPTGPEGQLGRFVEKRGEGFYAVSIDVGNLDRTAEVLEERGVPFIDTRSKVPSTPGEGAGFLWISPGFTKGVAVQLTWPWSTEQGTNANLLGLSSAVIAVADIDAALPAYEQLLGLRERERVRDDRFGYEAAVLPLGESDDTLLLARATDPEKPFGQHVARKGAGIFQFTLTAKDLSAEVARLRARGLRITDDGNTPPRLAWIDPADARGIRIELAQA